MFLFFPAIVIASLFGKVSGGNVIYTICRLWADILCFLTGIRHINIYESPHDISRSYIFLSNHISYMDIPMIMKSVRKQHVRVLGKAGMGKIPVFGYIYKSAVVMVDRESASNRFRSIKVLKSVIKKGISVFICPEGTFNMGPEPLKSFYDGAFRIAIETQTPIKPLLFLDTYDRLSYESIFSFTPGKSRTVFLEEVDVSGYAISEVPLLKTKVYRIMKEALIRYNASWIGKEHYQD
ncbi:MAG: lysophospholipid acyltransferase family protein [Chitinophagaceae bacterium]